jgi:nuclear transport factor 2 (NTF2) superfamily protein
MCSGYGYSEICLMEKINKLPAPPWDMESAATRLKMLEDDYNSLKPDQICANFTINAEVRFGTELLNGREAIKQYVANDLNKRRSYNLTLDLWGALKGRMAVRYELRWSNVNGNKFKTFGVQVFQFNDDGLVEMNFSSYNDEQQS